MCLPICARALLLAASIPLLAHAQPDEGWQLRRQADGIQAYSRTRPGAELNDFKVSAHLACPLATARQYMMGQDHFASWVGVGMKHFGVVDFKPREVAHLYMVWPTPPLVPDRDFVLAYAFGDTKSGFILHVHAEPAYVQPNPRYIRMDSIDLVWAVRDLGADSLEIQYRGIVDPKGRIPKGFANATMLSTPIRQLSSLRAALAAAASAPAALPPRP